MRPKIFLVSLSPHERITRLMVTPDVTNVKQKHAVPVFDVHLLRTEAKNRNASVTVEYGNHTTTRHQRPVGTQSGEKVPRFHCGALELRVENKRFQEIADDWANMRGLTSSRALTVVAK